MVTDILTCNTVMKIRWRLSSKYLGTNNKEIGIGSSDELTEEFKEVKNPRKMQVLEIETSFSRPEIGVERSFNFFKLLWSFEISPN